MKFTSFIALVAIGAIGLVGIDRYKTHVAQVRKGVRKGVREHFRLNRAAACALWSNVL